MLKRMLEAIDNRQDLKLYSTGLAGSQLEKLLQTVLNIQDFEMEDQLDSDVELLLNELLKKHTDTEDRESTDH